MDQGNQVIKVKRRYIRLFDNPDNVQDAIDMLNAGMSFSHIGRILKCDRTSVMSFFEREKEKGVVFTRTGFVMKEDFNEKDRQRDLVNCLEVNEKINRGKSSYKEYLAVYKKTFKNDVDFKMEQAKKSILEARKAMLIARDVTEGEL